MYVNFTRTLSIEIRTKTATITRETEHYRIDPTGVNIPSLSLSLVTFLTYAENNWKLKLTLDYNICEIYIGVRSIEIINGMARRLTTCSLLFLIMDWFKYSISAAFMAMFLLQRRKVKWTLPLRFLLFALKLQDVGFSSRRGSFYLEVTRTTF